MKESYSRRLLLLVLLATFSACLSVRAEVVATNEKEIYWGYCLNGDLIEEPIKKYTSGSCSYYCKNLDGCIAWTFVDDYHQCKTFYAYQEEDKYEDPLCTSGILATATDVDATMPTKI